MMTYHCRQRPSLTRRNVARGHIRGTLPPPTRADCERQPAMELKLIESAQRRSRMANAQHLVGLVRAGGVFVNGKLAERPGEDAALAA
jgi:hypothetical protein